MAMEYERECPKCGGRLVESPSGYYCYDSWRHSFTREEIEHGTP